MKEKYVWINNFHKILLILKEILGLIARFSFPKRNKMKRNKKYYYCEENPYFGKMILLEGYPFWEKEEEYVHRTVAKQHLLNGDNFRDNEEVHHVDGDKFNFHPSNLIVLDKKDHKKITRRLNKERNLNRANLLIFVLIFIAFAQENNPIEGIFNWITLFLLIAGVFVWAYSNFFDWFIRKTRLYKIMKENFDE